MRPSGECQCGARAERICRDCALAYCDSCCARRHAKGAFQRHTIVAAPRADAAAAAAPAPQDAPLPGDSQACDECAAAPAVLHCDACELRFCAACSARVHSSGAMQRHADFAALAKPPGSGAGARQRDAFGLKTEMIRDGEATETPLGDPDQEAAPSSPALAKSDADPDANTTTADADAESYDLWSSWSVRSFSERSSSIDSTSQWRSMRSLSIDSKASAADDDLPLASLSQSLQSLAFSSPPPPAERSSAEQPPAAFAQRPRSYSDYTSLRSSRAALGDLWREPPTASPALELWRALKTSFPSRHVVVKSATGAFDAADVQRVTERLASFGSLARIRDELATDGLLFFTFCELTAAIGVRSGWFPGGDAADFCLPFEAPDDVNCATLLVQLHGPPAASADMRQFCARFGDVASVLQNDVNSSKYVLEFNDARDVPGALRGLGAAHHPLGAVAAARTSPPTLDVAKLQLFQEHVDNAAARGPSFSSSTTSMLTLSPTSSSSSPLNASFLEPPVESSAGADAVPGIRPRTASPFDSSSFQLPEDPIWSGGSGGGRPSVRPRSSSSSLIGLGAAAPVYAPEPVPFANPYSSAVAAAAAAAAASTGSGTFPPFLSSRLPQQPNQASPLLPRGGGGGGGGPHFYQPHPRLAGTATKFASARSGSDPGFRAGYASSGSSSSGGQHHHLHPHPHQQPPPVVTGRNDQGVGEFCLSIDRVASGADKRTTLMVRNIPNKYTQQMLLAEINARHRGRYDFFYLPIDFKNKCNMGYAFINFIEAAAIVPFYQEFDAQKWSNFNSEKVCAISYARLQGKQAMIARFQNSSLLDKHESYRPLVFASAGANRGQPEPFPAPKQPLPHHHKKQLTHHPHHHHLMLAPGGGGAGTGGGGDDAAYGGSLAAQSHQFMQNHHHHHQMQQAMHHAHQLMAGQLAHNALHGLAPPGAEMPPHLSYHPQLQLHEQLAMHFHHPHHRQFHPHPAVRHVSTESHVSSRAAAEFSP